MAALNDLAANFNANRLQPYLLLDRHRLGLYLFQLREGSCYLLADNRTLRNWIVVRQSYLGPGRSRMLKHSRLRHTVLKYGGGCNTAI